jgi:hypothetical protein
MHNTGAIFVAVAWLAAMLYRKSTRPILPILAAGVLSLPALGFLLPQAGVVGAGYWIPPLNHPGRIVATLDDLIWFQPKNPYVLATAIITSLALSLVIYDLRQIIHKNEIQFCLLLTVTPLAVISLVSLVWQPILISRVMAPAAPFFLLLLAQIVSVSKQRLQIFGWFSAPIFGLITVGIICGQLGRDPVDASMQADLRAADGIYHANVGSYVVWHYYLPDVPQFIWPQQTTVQQTLSPQTRTAMGMNEIDFDFIKCVSLADGRGNVIPIRRWALIYFHNPTTSAQEIEYVARLHQQYRARKLRNLRSDQTTEAWLSIIEPECDYAE